MLISTLISRQRADQYTYQCRRREEGRSGGGTGRTIARYSAGAVEGVEGLDVLKLLRRHAEAALFLRVRLDGLKERLGTEVGPHDGQEDELGVGGFEQQEIADAGFATGADQEIDVGERVRRHDAVKRPFVDFFGEDE